MKAFLPITVVLTALIGCGQSDEVTIRKFPYPYEAALAICSDIDETETIEEFLHIQEFLNTDRETSFGRGLNLDIGNSFWFYNQYYELHQRRLAGESVPDVFFPGNPDFGISIFDGTSGSLSATAPVILAMIKAGYADCLHSYGNFGKGGFTRALAAQAIRLLDSLSLAAEVFVNHGGEENENNLGDASWFLGDNPEANVYHADLTLPMGIKFLWRGQMTHCIGQDADFDLVDLAKRLYEYLQDLFYAEQSYPHDNRLVHIFELDDGRKIFEFVRYINPWGRYSVAREPFIAQQLGRRQVDQLVKSRGYMIFYTHLGANQDPPYLHQPTIEAMRHIKTRFDDGDLLVTTTSKLLNYYVHRKHLFWRQERRADSLFIMIDSIANEVEGSFVPDERDLEGITFYIPGDYSVTVSVHGRSIPCQRNDRDETGRVSISIPWQRLTLPEMKNLLP